jgi:tetratricopeptide (TPR) repeat protein
MIAAAREGAASAVALTETMNIDAAQKSTILQAASGTLVRRGDYEGGAKVLDAIRVEGEEARTIQRRGTMLRGMVRTSEGELTESTAAEFATKVLTLGAVRDKDDHAFATRYLAAGARLGGQDAKLVKELESKRQELAPRVSRQLMLDLMKRGQKTVVDGNKDVGYRVKVTFEFGQGNSETLFLVDEDGKLVVRAMDGFLGEVGAGAWEALEAGKQARAKQWLDWAREVLAVSKEEDPLRVPPFGRLWNEGKGDLKGAAATLAAFSGRAKSVLPYLEKRLAAAKTSDEKQTFLQAITFAASELKEDAKSLSAARALVALVPSSKIARRLLFSGLWNTQDYAGVQSLAERSLQSATAEADKHDLKGRLAAALTQQGKFAEASQHRTQLMASAPNWADNYNNAAWTGLFAGPTQQDIDYALRALELQRKAPHLHTLGCLYAELGQLDKAGKTLLELRGMRKDGILASEDWYIVGRVAEHLGFLDDARRAYAEIKKPEYLVRTATYNLAQLRLQKLR